MLTINNFQEFNTAEVSLDSIRAFEISSGYLNAFPDRWIIKAGVHGVDKLTPPFSIENL